MYTLLRQAGKQCHLDGTGPSRIFIVPSAPGVDDMDQTAMPSDYIPVAIVDVSSVKLQRNGFTLEGRGADKADYRVDLDLEVPVDQRTRTVLGELLSQSRWRISRKAPQPLRPGKRVTRPRQEPTPG